MTPPDFASAPGARLRASGITVTFGTLTALDAVTVEVQPRQVLGVIGPNGAGKTTLLDVIAGATTPDAGELLMDGEPLVVTPATIGAVGIARTVQGHELPPGRALLDYVLDGAEPPRERTGLGALLNAISRLGRGREGDPEADQHAVQVLRELGLAPFLDEPLEALSHAVRARAAIAHATVVFPRLLLLDEPAAGLGADERRELATLIRSLAIRPGRDNAVVLVDHHFDLISQACDTVVVLDRGRVVAQGTPDELASDGAVAEAYLG